MHQITLYVKANSYVKFSRNFFKKITLSFVAGNLQVVHKSQFSEKEQNCVKLANPPSQTSNKKKKKNKKSKNAVFPDLEERG